MAKYELSIDPSLVAEAEQVVALEGRAFPTLVTRWDSNMLGQQWHTTVVLDYTIPLPPLKSGASFNEVRVAAFTADVPTKFLYFGTELNADAPRISPEMENAIADPSVYQEYRISAEASSVPYLELISTTPRIYGNGPQDYYSPPIKVERYDAGGGTELIADNFPEIVAALPPIPGDVLTNPNQGFWQGARFAGTKRIAILKDGSVVGLCQRATDKEVVPPEVQRRDPHADVRDAWVAIDLGAQTTTVAIGKGERHELIRLGAVGAPTTARDYENPSELYFNNLPSVLKAWRDRVILPLVTWGDVLVGHASQSHRRVHGKEKALRAKACVTALASLPGRLEGGADVFVVGRSDLDGSTKLEKPAAPIIDDEGIDPDAPFDPLELYAYYIGLTVNTRQRGIHLRYAVGMPTGWPAARREQVLASLRRGLLRSLPAGMVAFDDLDLLQVVDAGPNVLSFAAFAFRVFAVIPKSNEPVPFVAVDAGATETSVICGQYRKGTADEVAAGLEKVIEHVDPTVLSDLGGEHLLHRMAYKVYAASATSMQHNEIPFQPPSGEDPVEGAGARLNGSFDAQLNVRLLKDAVRPILEASGPQPLPDMVQLYASDGRVRDVRIMIDRAVLSEWLRGQLSEAAVEIKEAIAKGFSQVTRDEAPYSDLKIMIGGRLGMHAFLLERLEAVLPSSVKVHKFREADHTNLSAPTVKIATALGILTLRQQHMGPTQVSDDRSSFKFRVGRAKRGVMFTVLDGSTGYDAWRELGACTRPDVTVLYTESTKSGDLATEDPEIRRVVCSLGYDAVGYRVYMRAVAGARVEVSVGPPGGRPDEDAPLWELDLEAGTAAAVGT